MKGVQKIQSGILKTTAGKVALGGTLAILAAGAVAVVGFLLANQGYRTIAVQEVNGTGIVQNEKQESTNAYAGMHLYSGDDVTVQETSDMTLQLDMDKYVYAEANTHFWLEAEGDEETSKTRIYLEQGSELNRLGTKLTKGSEYEVNTPNSVMAVRGTVFRVTVYFDSDGIAWACVEVFDGEVEIFLKTLDGELTGVSEVFGPGEAALIRASSDFSEFVAGENGEIKQPIDYKEIPQNTASKLVEFIDDGEELCIGKDLLMDYTQLKDHEFQEVVVEEATCLKEGKKEIRCVVCDEVKETVVIPKLSHEVPDEWEIVTQPDCVNAGTRQKACKLCGEVVETEEIEATGHTEGEVVETKEATCTEDGESEQRCSICGEILQSNVIAALGHVAGDWEITKEATCCEEGERVKICTRCKEVVKTASIEALGHSYGNWTQTKASTCSVNGSQSRTCSVCGEIETTTIALLAHSYGEWVELKAATCTDNGSQSRTCGVCGHVDTSVIYATGHTYIIMHDLTDFATDNEGLGTASVVIMCERQDYGDEDVHQIQFNAEMRTYYCLTCNKDVTSEAPQ